MLLQHKNRQDVARWLFNQACFHSQRAFLEAQRGNPATAQLCMNVAFDNGRAAYLVDATTYQEFRQFEVTP